MEGTLQAEHPGGLFEQARRALAAVEREETEARRQLALPGQKAEQWTALREVRERLHAVRRNYELLERRAGELQYTIRREGRAVAQWQQQVKNTEEQLARWQRLLAEAQARLEEAQREFGRLTGFGGGAGPPP